MDHLIIKQTRIPYKRSNWGCVKVYMRLFMATDKRYPTQHSGTGATKQQAVRDLGRIILHTTSLTDKTGRLEQGWQYLKY